MKKQLSVLLILCLLCVSLAGCGNNGSQTAAAQGTAQGTAQETVAKVKVDVDLSKLGANVLKGEIDKIFQNPENYLGKTIKMKGLYFSSYYDVTDTEYKYIVVEKADACCLVGLEFSEKTDTTRNEYDPIEITGVYESYEEMGQTYYQIVVA